MQVTLYTPGQLPRTIEPDGFILPDSATGFAQVTDRVAQELSCASGLVDVQDSGPDFVAYTVFDCEGAPNELATEALMKWSKHPEAYLDSDPESQLCGPVLLVTKS